MSPFYPPPRQFFNRQQCGLHGGASAGAQPEIRGNDDRPAVCAAGALSSRVGFAFPQVGQATAASRRTSNSNRSAHCGHSYSNNGIEANPEWHGDYGRKSS